MTRDAAVELAPGVWRIPTMPFDAVNSFAFVDDDGQVTLVDTGTKRAPRRIAAGLQAMGLHLSHVTRILLTHAHADHAGGLARVRASTGAPVLVHQRDAAYVRTGTVPTRDRSTTGGRLLNRLPGGGFAPVDVGQELTEGQEIPVAGGLQVLHTPGHTPGHVSLLHPKSGVLVTGDSLFNWRSRITWSFASWCTDAALAKRTAGRFADLDFDLVAFTHGPEIRNSAREAVRGFLRDSRVAR